MTAVLDDLLTQADDVDPDTDEVAEFLARWGDRYSPRNLLLLFVQRPDAAVLHTYRGWVAEGRQVRKGEKAIRLMAPRGRKDDVAAEDTDTDVKVRVRPISLFDVSQTDAAQTEGEAAT